MTIKKVKSRLIAARALIADADNWVKKVYAQNSEGKGVSPFRDTAEKFCMTGALQHVGGIDEVYEEALYHLETAIGGTEGDVPYFNDAKDTCHKHVIEAYDKAIQDASN